MKQAKNAGVVALALVAANVAMWVALLVDKPQVHQMSQGGKRT